MKYFAQGTNMAVASAALSVAIVAGLLVAFDAGAESAPEQDGKVAGQPHEWVKIDDTKALLKFASPSRPPRETGVAEQTSSGEGDKLVNIAPAPAGN